MKAGYMYPISARSAKVGARNPYVADFMESVGVYVDFLNRDTPSTMGVFGLIRFLLDVDYLFFNWVEDLPDKKGGLAQTLFLLVFLNVLRLTKIQVIWTMHNKLSHSSSNYPLKKAIFRTLLKRSSWILTHAREGIEYAELLEPRSSERAVYMPHPVKNRTSAACSDKKTDILIWGTLSAYKGVLEFLRYLYERGYQNRYQILIIGHASSNGFFRLLCGYASERIEIRNECPDDNLLSGLIKQSRVVLFTYSGSSVLSSGALMDSIGFGATVVGPHVGAFADHGREGLIRTFRDFDELIRVVDSSLSGEFPNPVRELELFLHTNTWERFAASLNERVKFSSVRNK